MKNKKGMLPCSRFKKAKETLKAQSHVWFWAREESIIAPRTGIHLLTSKKTHFLIKMMAILAYGHFSQNVQVENNSISDHILYFIVNIQYVNTIAKFWW